MKTTETHLDLISIRQLSQSYMLSRASKTVATEMTSKSVVGCGYDVPRSTEQATMDKPVRGFHPVAVLFTKEWNRGE